MASTNLWPVLMRIIFPIPASFLFLVCLPLPYLARRFVNRWVLRPFDKIFSFRIMGAPLIYIIIAASLALFSTMCVETYALGESEGRAADFTEKMNLRGRRWRAERNFYISLMFLSCSILADRVRLMLKETEKLNEQIRELRRS